MWALLTNRLVQIALVATFVLGTTFGWVTHNYAIRASQAVQTWVAERKADKANENEAKNDQSIEKTASRIEASIRSSGADASVSGQLDCLFRSAFEGKVTDCLPDPVPKPPECVPVAQKPVEQGSDSLKHELSPKAGGAVP